MSQTAVWLSHPNAQGPVSMLLGIHGQFRHAATRLRELTDAGADVQLLARVFVPLAQVLHHHHHAEEQMLFPVVHKRTGVEPEQLQTDHDEMTAAIDVVERSLRAGQRDAAAILAFCEILTTHLDREEELVIPVLLALKPDEMWAMMHA